MDAIKNVKNVKIHTVSNKEAEQEEHSGEGHWVKWLTAEVPMAIYYWAGVLPNNK